MALPPGGTCGLLALLTLLGIPAQALSGRSHRADRAEPVDGRRPFPAVDGARPTWVMLLWLRSREPGVGQLLVRRPLVLLTDGIAAVTAVVLVIGTVVTGSGPHSGDPEVGDAPGSIPS